MEEAQQLDPVEPNEVVSTPEAVETPAASPIEDRRANIAAAFDRPRDESGRFAPTSQEAVEEAPAVKAEESPAITDEDLQELGLKKEEFDHFRSPQAVDAFKRRLEETTAGYEKLQTNADFGGKMREVLQPYEATIQSMGVEPTTAVQTLLAADHALRYGPEAQKVQMFQRLAQSYGVSLEGLTQEQPEIDPQYSALQSEIERLRAEQNQFVTGMQQQTQQQLNSEIEAFAKDHEHFDTVREDMAMLMEVGKAGTLEDAYNKALRLNDELAAQINAQQHEEAEKARREKAAQAAQAAKQAAVSVTGAPVAGNAAPSHHDRRAVLAAAMADR